MIAFAAVAGEASRQGRNELCGCGSGRKFKRCCGSAEAPGGDAEGNFFRVAGILTAGMLLVGGIAVARVFLGGDEGAEPRRVWSSEHGHWHVAGAKDGTHAVAPGKVWDPQTKRFRDGVTLTESDKPQPGALEERTRAEAEAARARAQASADR